MKTLFLASLCFFVVLSFSSCNENKVFSEHQDVAAVGFKWNMEDEKSFKVPIENEGVYDVSVEVRHGRGIKYGNLLLTLTHEDPEGKTSEENINLLLREEGGQLKGEGMGDMYDVRQVALDNFEMKKGTYTFKVKHRMPEQNPLNPVLEVGLVVEKAQ